MRASLISLTLFVVIAAAVSPAAAQTGFKDLLPRMPEDANALVLIHARRLRESDFARDFAAKTLRGATQANQYVVPRDEIERLVLAAEFTDQLTPVWETSVIETNQTLSLAAMAAQGSGQKASLADLDALKLNTNSYLVQFAPKLYGAYVPANRQKATRWVERAEAAKEVRLTSYLSKIAEYPETTGTEVMLALDLAGMIDVNRVRNSLAKSETLKNRSQVNKESLAHIIASIEGVALGVKATDTLNGKLRVDFGTDPGIMAEFAKPLLLEKLGDLGLMIEDFESWEGSIRGNTFYLGGDLSPTGLRRVLSLIDPPSIPALPPQPKDMPSASELDPMALPSQRYFREITALLDEMSDRSNLKYAKQFSWYDKHARKISQLSMVNVDPDLMNYGLATATALRSMAFNLRNQAAEASQYSNNRTTTWNAYGDWWNGYFVTYDTQPAEREKAEKMAKMYGTMSYAETVQNVGNMTAQMRAKMVERYKIDF